MSGSSEPSTAKKHLPAIVIRPFTGWRLLDLRELWEHRELLYFFTWRDLKVRYKQTVIGVAWAVIQPVLLMVLFTAFFSSVLGVQSGGIPYPVFAYAGLLPWGLFSAAITNGGTSITNNQSLVTKVYFPRLFLPLSAVFEGVVDFAVASVVLVGLMFYYGVIPSLTIIALPLFVLLAIITSAGVAFWLSAFDVRYRDIHYTIPFLVQFWLFATPIIYPVSRIPSSIKWIASLNPMTGVVEGFRWALLGQSFAFDAVSWVSVVVAILVFVSGLFYFQRVERIMADVV